ARGASIRNDHRYRTPRRVYVHKAEGGVSQPCIGDRGLQAGWVSSHKFQTRDRSRHERWVDRLSCPWLLPPSRPGGRDEPSPPCQLHRRLRRLLCRIIVTSPCILNQAESVAERVAHCSHEPPGICLDISLEAGTGYSRVANRDLDVLDHKIQMHRSPVAPIVAQHGNRGASGCTRSFGQEIDG